MTSIECLTRKSFLNGFVANIRRITFTLNSIFYSVFVRNDIYSLIAAAFCYLDIGITVFAQQIRTKIFKSMAFHIIELTSI